MDKAKKKRLKQYIAWVTMAAVVALLAAMPLMARKEAQNDGPVASILEGTVQVGDIQTGLRGGGTLSAGNAMDVELPKGVKITEFLVNNGDSVREGDPVATVDKVSVMTAIVQVRESMEYIREEMADAKDEKAASAVKSTAGGRIKAVYAQAGDSVQDVMLRHGALAVLSLDGMMALDLEVKTGLAAGDSVQVAFDEGTTVSGRVESNLDGHLVVTVEDRDYALGTQVTVTGPDGTELGVGELYAHNAWKAMAFTGTVSAVSAKENTNVSEGATLFTLKETDVSGTRDTLASLHREYEELLQKLFAMYETEVITAPCDGKISGVNADSPYLLSAAEEGWTVMLLSSTGGECTGTEDCPAARGDHEDGCPMKCTLREGCTARDHITGCAVYCTMLPDCGNLNHKTGCLGVCTGNGDTCQSTRPPQTHQKSCFKRCISDLDEDPLTTCDADVHQDACIENCTKDESCTALTHKEGCWLHGVVYTAYAARVEVAGTDALRVIWGNTVYEVAPDGAGWKLVNPSQLQDVFVGEAQPLEAEDLSRFAAGDIVLLVTGTNSSGQVVFEDLVVYQKAQNGDTPGGMPGFPGGFGDLSGLFAGMGGMGGMGLYGGTQSTGFEFYELEGDTLMTVTEQDVMTLSIALDQKDISTVSLGKTALVKVNPLKGRSFEAEITDIGLFGTGNGGSSKFTVELTLPLEADMLPGMSAVAEIPLNTKVGVLTVSVAALTEENGKTLVFTALDPETGEPASPVEVTTGISDGQSVEILSGLASGDRYYYSYYDTVEVSTEVETDKYTFG